MPTSRSISALVFAATFVACRDTVQTTSPDLSLAASRGNSGQVATVHINDACDPTTFAGVPGGCQRNGGMTLDQFTAQLTHLQRVPAWHFAPGDLNLREGDEFMATNMGGEMHTFTEVEEFGGGMVPPLNALAGLPEPAPECLALGAGALIPPGGSSPIDDADEVGDELYQCCIHPWMRTTIHVRE